MAPLFVLGFATTSFDITGKKQCCQFNGVGTNDLKHKATAVDGELNLMTLRTVQGCQYG